MMIDADAHYLQSHEWAKKQGGNVYTVGLTTYAIEQLGDIVYMELPEAGQEITAGETFGVVESVKSASDMYAPLSGKIVEANDSIIDSPDTLKTDAYDAGWLIRIKISDPSEVQDLMDAVAYRKFLETEA